MFSDVNFNSMWAKQSFSIFSFKGWQQLLKIKC